MKSQMCINTILLTLLFTVSPGLGLGTEECSDHCRREGSPKRVEAARLQTNWAEPVNWKVVKQGEGWERVNLGPPAPHEIFPNPHRDPRLGSLSRDPIALRYWWE